VHTKIIMKHGGMLDKFVGDEIMAIFGAPLDNARHAASCLEAAMEMVEAHNQLLERWKDKDVKAQAGIGISTGECLVGEMGCELRTDYTCMGRVVNLGSRLCDEAKPKGIRISKGTLEEAQKWLKLETVEHTDIPVKGLAENISIWEVTGISDLNGGEGGEAKNEGDEGESG